MVTVKGLIWIFTLSCGIKGDPIDGRTNYICAVQYCDNSAVAKDNAKEMKNKLAKKGITIILEPITCSRV